MTQASRFRDLLKRDAMVVAPGAFDCITAKLIEQAEFAAVYMTGAGTAATLGYPDFGLVTMSEMVANAGRIAAAVALPVIADADTGYGNELNVFRTVREFEKSGVAGIHIEDQEFPKKCGHLEGKQVIPREDYTAKIRAAAAARRDQNLDLREAEAMGYKLAIVPGLLIKSVVGICDQMLAELKASHHHPLPVKEITVPEMFRRFGADEWDALRDRFRSAPAPRVAAE